MREHPWMTIGFTKLPRPILGPDTSLRFRCPLQQREVAWAGKDAFNPAAAVMDGRVALLVRCEDTIGASKGTSRIGLAWSEDGISFALEPEPVLMPQPDAWSGLEREGGCEDPRLVRRDDGTWICTYTAFDGCLARLCVATSLDLRRWTKHGPAFAGSPWENGWSKSGAIVSCWAGDQLVAARIGGRYWMYWGEGELHAATSDDGVRWTPVESRVNANRLLRLGADGSYSNVHLPGATSGMLALMRPRPGRFDHHLVEPGPAAVLGDAGIVLWYNGAAPGRDAGVYCPGQVLLDGDHPTEVIDRPATPYLVPDQPWELAGQNAAVVFSEGLVRFRGRHHLYYGCADSFVGVAIQSAAAPGLT